MTDSNEASPAAVDLIAAAVVASPPAPAEPAGRSAWLQGVGDLAVNLYRQAQALDADIAQLAAVQPITGVIVKVEDVKGRGVITLRPTMGRDQETTEDLRTPFLNEPRGAALFAQAKALVGATCRFGKFMEQRQDGSGQKIRMVAWIDALSAPPAATPPPTQGASSTTQMADPYRQAPPPAPAAPTPTASTASPSEAFNSTALDLGKLRNLKVRTWDEVLAAANQHFGIGEAQVWEAAMLACGAAGPDTAAGYAKTWNQIVTRFHQAA